jgi:hypothetical protein
MHPEKRPSGLVSIDAAGAAVKSLPTPPDHFRGTNTPVTRRLKVQFDGDWLSLCSRTRTRRARKCWNPTPTGRKAASVVGAQRCAAVGTADRLVGSSDASSVSALGARLTSSARHVSTPRPSIFTE